MTIPEILKRIDNLEQEIASECQEWKHNCQACSFERLCGDQLEWLNGLLKEAYCKEAEHVCSKCHYLNKCHSHEAIAEIKRQKHAQHLADCKAVHSDCTKCKRFADHCSFEKGHQEWLKLVEQCCAESDGCLRCPDARFCRDEKAARVLDEYYDLD